MKIESYKKVILKEGKDFQTILIGNPDALEKAIYSELKDIKDLKIYPDAPNTKPDEISFVIENKEDEKEEDIRITENYDKINLLFKKLHKISKQVKLAEIL